MDREKRYQDKLLEIRKQIDDIDGQVLPLLLSRMKCSEQVAKLKMEAEKPVYDPAREAEIIDGLRGSDEEYGASLAAIYTGIMSASRAKQHEMLANGQEIREIEKNAPQEINKKSVKVLCQGAQGSYSHRAAGIMFSKDSNILFTPEFSEVFGAVVKGEVEYGILPVENSVAGSVSEVYKLLLEHRCYIVEAVAVKVDHCVAVYDQNEPLHTVISHPQALRQCEEYICQKGWKTIEFSNTAAAAEHIRENKLSGVGAICSTEAATARGLTIIAENIHDEAYNITRFVVIAKKPILSRQADKISLCFALPHTTGSLHNILENFAVHGLSLTKIESVPIAHRQFEYDFYLDFTGNIHDTKTLELICSLDDELSRFSFLGNYKEWNVEG